MSRFTWFAVILFQSCLLGCVSQPEQKADIIIPDAHGGGSALAIAPDSSTVTSGGWNGRVRVWRLPAGEEVSGWQAHRGEVTHLFFLSKDRLLSSGYDGRLAEWALSGRSIRDIDTGSPVLSLALDSSGKRALTGHGNGSIRLWALPEFALEREVGRHGGGIRAVAFSPDGERFASSSTDGQVKLWGKDDGTETLLPAPGSDARTLVFSADGARLFGAGWFDLYRWDLDGLQLTTLDTDHQGIINRIEFDPTGSYLASISRITDSSVLALSPETGETIRRYQSHELCGGSVTMAPDGKVMATTSDDASVMIWLLGQ
ncbi:MAG: hypothetical protein GY703_19560 [Gammaproteobacteria bacterium]|nr:hypothetical protein [Gammaproteobacteria bacterium]